MDFQSELATAAEHKIRKFWLFSTIVLFIFLPLINFIRLAVEFEVRFVPMILLAYTVTNVVPVLVIWYFAYKRFGTKLLIVWLVFSFLQPYMTIAGLFITPVDYWQAALATGEITMFICWFVLSVKMMAINRSVKKRCCMQGV